MKPMKTISATAVFLSVFISLSAGAEKNGAGEPVPLNKQILITQKDAGRTIEARVGDTIRLELPAHGAAGYTWQAEGLNEDILKISKTESMVEPDKSMVGRPVIVIWRLEAVAAGEAQLKMLYFRPWEGKGSAVGSFAVKVRITGQPRVK
ncbi:MAG TPA: protease inhibitor I42 family protein [Nitrospirota bacterium]